MSVSIDEYSLVTNPTQIRNLIENEYERTGGIFRLAPTWVGRPGIIIPGRRIKLNDIYINQFVAVNERWFASITYADNGGYNSVCPADHGLSYVIIDKYKFLFRDFLAEYGYQILGAGKKWDVLAKFFDNNSRIPSHLHPCQSHVKPGLIGKPESYHFPLELNINPNNNPRTTVGIDLSISDSEILDHLKGYKKGDNRLTDLGIIFNLISGTGYYMPPCTLHGPGSLVTYELQVASDVSCIPESRVDDLVMPIDMVDRDLPVSFEKDGDEKVYQYILSMIRCPNSGNTIPFRQEYFRPPITVYKDLNGYQDWVIYRTGKASDPENPDLYSAKHTVVFSEKTFEIKEKAAFGIIVLGGYGFVQVPGKEPVSLENVGFFPSRSILGGDDVFISYEAASNLVFQTKSYEDLSFYQHFASQSNPESTHLSIPGI